MTALYLAAAAFLLASLGAGLWRIARGPTAFDRMLAAQLFGTTGVATLLLLAYGLAQPALVDVGLVFGLLAVIAVVAFVREPIAGARRR
jgi:multicomponent Na+:H+ antiporter subunit F